MGNIIDKISQYIKDIGLMIPNMALGMKHGMIFRSIMGNITMEKRKEWGRMFGQMERLIKASGKII